MKLFKPPRIANWVFPRYTWRFAVSDPIVFLTFDDGPHPEITPFVLDLLLEFQWKATFFCVGENIQKYPHIVDRIIKEGHSIGNHTQNHSHAFRVSNEEYLASFEKFNAHTKTRLFRPPYGRLKPSLAKTISRTHQIIMWSWLSYDYDTNVHIETILDEAKKIKPGNIIVLHDNSKIVARQQELLPKLFQLWKSNGLKSAAISLDA